MRTSLRTLRTFAAFAATLFLGVASAFAAIELSDLTVTTIEPFGLAIDYKVDNVMDDADGHVPEVTLTLADGTVFVAKTVTGATDTAAGTHRIYWNMAKDGIDSFENATISVTYKDSNVVGDGKKYCVIDLSGGTDATSYSLEFRDDEPDGGFTNDTYKTTKLVLKRVEAGEFTMGHSDAYDNQPHEVTLTKSFYMGLFEVTQKQWTLVMGSNPSDFSTDGDKKPVEQVSYNMIRGSSTGAKWPTSKAVDASSFLGKLRAKTGNLLFDLPTEAQWEYACRAGTTTTYSFVDSAAGDYMWYRDNSEVSTHEVGTKKANPWGFYDMYGNVWEWCLDWYSSSTPSGGTDPKGSSSGSSRVLRGGCWSFTASCCTSSYRACNNPSGGYNDFGFRLSRTLPTTSVTPVTPVATTGVGANILKEGSTISETVTFNCNQIEGKTPTITVNGNGEEVDSSSDSYAWLPNKVGANTIAYTIDGNTFTVVYDAEERAPVITDVQVTKVAPFGVAIDYTYTTMEGATGEYEPIVSAITSDGITTYEAKTLTKPLDIGTNKKRVYWNMAKDGIASLTDAKISVRLGNDQKVSEAFTVAGVNTSVGVDGATITDELTLDLCPVEVGGALIAADGNEIKTSAIATTFLYRPTTNGKHVLSHVAFNTLGDEMVMSAEYTFNLPPLTLSEVSVSKIEPFGLAIDYKVDNVMDGVDGHVPEVALTLADGTVFVAKTVTGATDAAAGTHRIYWNMAKDGIDSFEGATISVTYKDQDAEPEPVVGDGKKYCIIDLSGGMDATSYPLEFRDDEPEGGFTNDTYKTTKLVLKRVDAGSFKMQNSSTVKLTKSFYMGLFEVTQKQWTLVMGSNPSDFSTDGDKKPVEQVSYDMIRGSVNGANWPTSNAVDEESFLGKLRAKTGNLAFDLPTQAQWEYTCRAGTTTKWSFGDDENLAEAYMWYTDNSSSKTHEVGTRKANPWGFYDMHGNVLEWCLDWFGTLSYGTDPGGSSSGSYRALRGGSWYERASYCTSSFLYSSSPSSSYYYSGFRLSRTLPTTSVTPVAKTGVGANILKEGASISETVTFNCNQIEGKTTITVNDEEVDTSSGSYAWLPNKVGANTIAYTIDGNTFTVVYDAEERAPVITDVQVTKVAPFGVAIDYTYTTMEGATGEYEPIVSAITSDGITTYEAKTLTQPLDLGTNKKRVYWNMAKDGIASLTGAEIRVRLKEVLDLPDYYVIDLSNGSAASSYGVSYLNDLLDEDVAALNCDENKTTKLVLKRVDAGTFIMGEDQTDESHRVTLTKPFYLGLFEVTQAQWLNVTGSNPSNFNDDGAKNPVEQVSYDMIRGSVNGANWPTSNAVDADSFLGKLLAKTGNLAFDLPTEAQWEYACRAGTTTTYSFVDSAAGDYMWYRDNSEYSTHEVGTRKANPWGFYDMHGNVVEYCLDWFGTLAYGTDPKGSTSGSDRVWRGGFWGYDASGCDSSFRGAIPSLAEIPANGFRLALHIDQKVSDAFTVSGVNTSVVVDGATITDELTLDLCPAKTMTAAIEADGDVIEISGEGVTAAVYRPKTNGKHTLSHGIGDVVMSAEYTFNLPPLTLSEVSVSKVEPFGLAIDYKVDNVMDGADGYVPEVTLTLADGTTKIVAKTLTGATDAKAGQHRIYWNMAKDGIDSFENATISVAYYQKAPRYCVIDLQNGSDAVSYETKYLGEDVQFDLTNDATKTSQLILQRVDPGTYLMQGTTEVTLTQPFYLGLFEVTQKQWELVTGSNPCAETGYGKGDAYPVHYVSYDMIRGATNGALWPTSNAVDADSFLGKLRARTGDLAFDLPTEAQWEYACRAGTTTTYCCGDTPDGDYMWYWDNADRKTHPVGEKLPNKWGFYDMPGNVLEWCLDYDGTISYGIDPAGGAAAKDAGRVVCGGCWYYGKEACASSYRNILTHDCQGMNVGFRLALTLPAVGTDGALPVATLTSSAVSANILKTGSKISETVTFNCNQIEGKTPTITVNGNGEEVDSSSGSYAWLPNKVGANTIAYTIDGNTFTVVYDAEERAPVITDVQVTKVAPFGVAIDYTYTTMEGATAEYEPVVSAITTDGITTYEAKTLTKTLNIDTNKNRVYWNMAKDGIASLTDAKISVRLGNDQKVSEAFTVAGVNTSVVVDGAMITDELTLDLCPTEVFAAIWADGNEIKTSAIATTFLYRPTTNGKHTLSHGIGDVVMSVEYAFNLPPLTLSEVSVTKIEPFGLAIDYKVDNVMDGADGYVPEVTLTDENGTVFVAKTVTGATDAKAGTHRIYWNMAKDGIDSFEDATINVTYKEAPYCVIDLTGGTAAESYPVTYLASEPEGGFTNDTYKTTKLVLKRVDAGEFIMGEDKGNTVHRVTFTKSFYMGLFEVTQKQWELVLGENPCAETEYGKGDAYPVHYVSYNDIRGSSKGANWPTSNAVDEESFLGKLRAKTGNLEFDLPTEAQWEYTCRAGTTTTYSYGNNANGEYMWYDDNSSASHTVGTKKANPWGFYDMHGNVWEWCLDWYGTLSYGTDPGGSPSGSYRVFRGGCWDFDASYCTSSYRSLYYPSGSINGIGFRLSRTLPTTSVTPVMKTGVSAQYAEVQIDEATAKGFGYSGTYDGEEHGIGVDVPDTVLTDATVAYALSKSGPFVAENPLFTNACNATVWYAITAEGYVTYTNSATVAIAKRPVTITSATKTDFVYDGTAHELPLIIISENGFVAGEGITTSNWATVTTVAQGEVANTFDYAAAEGTDLANYDVTVVTGKIAVAQASVVPSIAGDSSATVTGDATSGWTVAPSEGVSSVEVTIPDGVDAAKVTVEVGVDVAAVTSHGAKVKVVSGGHDITDYLDVPSADAAGSIDLTKAAVKEAVVKEAMDPSKGAKFEVKASEPTLTTSATRPGLVYTLREGTTLDGMSDGASKLGDGSPWTPEITVKGGASGFYSIKVTK